jgi:hypothetical protein
VRRALEDFDNWFIPEAFATKAPLSQAAAARSGSGTASTAGR